MSNFVFDGTFDGWRERAREALVAGISPARIQWRSALDGQEQLFTDERPAHPQGVHQDEPGRKLSLRISRDTLSIFESAACYRDPERWDLLYRLMWRLMHGEPGLMNDVLDPDVRRILRMDKQIRRDVHKMHAFVRFREAKSDDDVSQYVAWFEPAHDIVLRAAPFFVRRFTSMCWSILTPYICVHWNRHTLEQSSGVSRRDAPKGDDMEALWKTYYTHIFNPARIKTHAMLSEMPKRYWINLPEAELIESLVRDASSRVAGFKITENKLPKSQTNTSA